MSWKYSRWTVRDNWILRKNFRIEVFQFWLAMLYGDCHCLDALTSVAGLWWQISHLYCFLSVAWTLVGNMEAKDRVFYCPTKDSVQFERETWKGPPSYHCVGYSLIIHRSKMCVRVKVGCRFYPSACGYAFKSVQLIVRWLYHGFWVQTDLLPSDVGVVV